MARIAVLLVVLLCVPWLAGCAGEKPKDCPDPCPGISSSPPPASATETPMPTIPPDSVLNETIEFRNCEGVGSLTTLPADRVRPLVPEDFQLVGFTPITVNAHISVFRCERIVDQARVYEQAYYFNSFVHVAPRNESRDVPGVDWYLLDERVSVPEIAEHIAAIGMPIEPATFAVANTSAGVAATLQNWKVTSQSSAFEINGIFGSEFQSGGGPVSYWGGKETLRRIDFEERYMYLNPKNQADALRTQGNSATRQAFGETSPMTTHILSELNMTWTISPENVFQPEQR